MPLARQVDGWGAEPKWHPLLPALAAWTSFESHLVLRCANRALRADTLKGNVALIGPSTALSVLDSRGLDMGWSPDKYRAAVLATDGATGWKSVKCRTFQAMYCPSQRRTQVVDGRYEP